MKIKKNSRAGKPILTKEIVAEIIEALKPSIQALLKMHGREFMHVVVGNPYNAKIPLFEGPVGKIEGQPQKYIGIATLKNELSARTGLNSNEVLNIAPHLMLHGEVIYQGSVNLAGLPVSASGGPGPLDEAISFMIAVNIRAYCQILVQKQQEAAKTGGPWVM
jgi:hypothetical protein